MKFDNVYNEAIAAFGDENQSNGKYTITIYEYEEIRDRDGDIVDYYKDEDDLVEVLSFDTAYDLMEELLNEEKYAFAVVDEKYHYHRGQNCYSRHDCLNKTVGKEYITQLYCMGGLNEIEEELLYKSIMEGKNLFSKTEGLSS